jgi:hypothetical protein
MIRVLLRSASTYSVDIAGREAHTTTAEPGKEGAPGVARVVMLG